MHCMYNIIYPGSPEVTVKRLELSQFIIFQFTAPIATRCRTVLRWHGRVLNSPRQFMLKRERVQQTRHMLWFSKM